MRMVTIRRCCFGKLGLAPWNGSLCLCEECLAGEGCSTAEPGYAKAPLQNGANECGETLENQEVEKQ